MAKSILILIALFLVSSVSALQLPLQIPLSKQTQQQAQPIISECEQAGGICIPVAQACPSGYAESNLSCKKECVCIALWQPVCGVDNKTYPNECLAKCAGVQIACQGECPCSEAFPFRKVIARVIINAIKIPFQTPIQTIEKCCILIQSQGYLQIATLKKRYTIGEQVNLTDPPRSGPQIKWSGSSERFESSEGRVIETESESPKHKGWIVQFKEPSLVEYVKAIEKGKEIKLPEIKPQLPRENVFTQILKRIKFIPTARAITTAQEYKQELFRRHDLALANIASTLKISKAELKAKTVNEFYVVFNGIALDINNEQARQLEKLPEVKAVWPNREVKALLNESIPLINADKTWQLPDPYNPGQNLTGKGMKIAIIDTGIDYTHPDLGGCFGPGCKVEGGWDVVNNDSDPMDDHGHGTHCAGIAAGTGAASNGLFKGVAPDAKLYAYKVLNSGGSGSVSWIIEGIERAADPNQDGNFSDHVDVISMSLGRYGGTPDDPDAQAVDNAVEAGVIVVIAAGNAGPDYETIACPGCARKAITVGASCKPNQIGVHPYCPPPSTEIAGFSSRGPLLDYTIKPDVVAPGVAICAPQHGDWLNDRLCYGSEYIAISGTSMATPHVAGAAALIKQAHLDWTPEEIKLALRNTAVDVSNDTLAQGYGRIDVLNATLSTKSPIAEILPVGIIRLGQPVINISGKAGGFQFRNYTLYFGGGINPSTWQPICSSNIANVDLLCENVNTTLWGEGMNTLMLEVNSVNGKSIDKILVVVDRSLHQGFPISVPFSGILPLTIEDINGDGKKEILTMGFNSVHIYYENGSEAFGWPQPLSAEGTGISTSGPYPSEEDRGAPSVGDINKDGKNEIIVGWAQNSNVSASCLYGWHYNGTPLAGFPYNCTDDEGTYAFYLTTVSLADLDGDGYSEIIGSFEQPGQPPKLFVWNYTGKVVEGWPYVFPNGSIITPSIGDVDNDGSLDIVVIFNSPSLSTVYIFEKNGSIKNTFSRPCGDVVPALSLADLNHDGQLELTIRSGACIQVYSWDGNLTYFGYTSGPSHHEAVYGHFDNGVSPGITFGQYVYPKLYILKHGNISELAAAGHVSVSPKIVDINSDNYADIIYATKNRIYAINSSGDVLNHFPKYGYGTFTSIAIEDIDSDQSLELIGITDLGLIYAWDLENSNLALMEWPMFHHDPQHTGNYNFGKAPLPKSLVNNTGTIPIQGYLLMKIQRKVHQHRCMPIPKCLALGGKCLVDESECEIGCLCSTWAWQDKAIVVDDFSANNLRTILPNSYLALDEVWAQAGSYVTNETGDFRVYAALLNSQGNVIETLQGKLEDSYEFKVI